MATPTFALISVFSELALTASLNQSAMPAIEQLPGDNSLITLISICPLSEPTYAVYTTEPITASFEERISQEWPVRYEPLAMWAIVEAHGKRQITGIHLQDLLQMQYCNQYVTMLGYSTSTVPMSADEFSN